MVLNSVDIIFPDGTVWKDVGKCWFPDDDVKLKLEIEELCRKLKITDMKAVLSLQGESK